MYAAICGMMLLHTAMAFSRKRVNRNDDAWQKRAAREWLAGGGTLTFADCCEALSLDLRLAERAIRECADKPRITSISRA